MRIHTHTHTHTILHLLSRKLVRHRELNFELKVLSRGTNSRELCERGGFGTKSKREFYTLICECERKRDYYDLLICDLKVEERN